MINSFGQYIGAAGSVRSSPSITSVGDGLNLSGKTLSLTFDPDKINNSFSFTRSPLTTDINDADGIQYKLGTLWIDTGDHKVFVLTSNDGINALWTELDDAQSELPTLGTGILTSNNNVWSATGDINSLITNGTITNSKLANVSTNNAGNSLVIRDSTGSTSVTNLKVTKIEPNSGTSVNINGWNFSNGESDENMTILDANNNMWLNTSGTMFLKADSDMSNASNPSHVFKSSGVDSLYIGSTLNRSLVDLTVNTKLITNEIKERTDNAGVSFTSKIKLQTIDPVDALQPITINGNVAFSGTKEIVMGSSTDNSRIVIWDGRSTSGESSTNYYGLGHGSITTSNSDEIASTAGFNDGRTSFLLHSLSSANGFLFTQGSSAVHTANKYQIQAGLRNKTFYVRTLNELFTDTGITCNSKFKIDELAERTASNGIVFNHTSKFDNGIFTNGISERTLDSGVSINHPLKCNLINERTLNNGIVFNHTSKFDNGIFTNGISERTLDSGVSINHPLKCDLINERTLNNGIVFNHAIKCDEIKEKTASNGVIINSALKLPNISNGYLSINDGVVTSSSGPSLNNDVIQSSTTVAPTLYTSNDKLAFYYDSDKSNLSVANRQTLPYQNTLTGTNNIGFGYSSLYKLTTGSNNICVGESTGSQYSTSYQNVIIGHNSNSSANGSSNSVVIGSSSAPYMTGQSNTIVGDTSATGLTSGYSNCIIGASTAGNLTTSYNNVIMGQSALSDGDGTNNSVVIGAYSAPNMTGIKNCTVGASSAESITSGASNSCFGYQSARALTTGNSNTCVGMQAGYSLTSGNSNTMLGTASGTLNNGANNICIGASAGNGASSWSGGSNILIGNNSGSGYTGSTNNNNIIIGHNVSGAITDTGIIRIGNVNNTTNTYIHGIVNSVVPGNPVYVSASGQLALMQSSIRYKQNVVDMEDTSFIYNLRPVNFEYKTIPGVKQFGLIAEETKDICNDLVRYNKDGDVDGLHEHKLQFMMLNEMKKLKQENDVLKQSVDDLKNLVMQLRTEMNELKTKNNVHFERMTPNTINDGEMKFYEITNGHLICKWKNGNIIKELDLIS